MENFPLIFSQTRKPNLKEVRFSVVWALSKCSWWSFHDKPLYPCRIIGGGMYIFKGLPCKQTEFLGAVPSLLSFFSSLEKASQALLMSIEELKAQWKGDFSLSVLLSFCYVAKAGLWFYHIEKQGEKMDYEESCEKPSWRASSLLMKSCWA